MESLYLLIPLSLLLVLGIGAVLSWAVMSGQFESTEKEGNRILRDGGDDDSDGGDSGGGDGGGD